MPAAFVPSHDICRSKESRDSLLDSVTRCCNVEETEAMADDQKSMNKLAVTYPLHIAAMLGWKRVLEILFKYGVDTSMKTRASGLQVIFLKADNEKSVKQSLIWLFCVNPR